MSRYILGVPLFAWLLIFIVFYCRENDWRKAILPAAMVWAVLLTLMNELLSLFKMITFAGLIGCWGLSLIILLGISFKRKFKIFPKINFSLPNLNISSVILLCGIALVISITGIIALQAPPNNWDAMTYHMARVMHWIQNQSVAHYPTHILRQLYQPPWAEYAIMHFQILSGGDYFANCVQWFSMIGSLVGVSLIAKELGANRYGQLSAAVIAGTIPMGILQASSTQNDYVLSFWLVAHVYYLLRLRCEFRWENVVGAGVSLGLAILTKGTAYIYAFPLLIWLGFLGWKKLRWKLWQPALGLIMIILALNLGQYARNYEVFKKPIGGKVGSRYSNEVFTAKSVASNIMRNLALHVHTSSQRISESVTKALGWTHNKMGVKLDDSKRTWPKTGFAIYSDHIYHEDLAGNLIHLVLIFIALGLFLRMYVKLPQENCELLKYAGAITGMFCLFCMYLKWQPWHSRLHLPLFVLWSPFIAIILSKTLNKKMVIIIAIFLLAAAQPWIFYNQTRSLIGKQTIFGKTRAEQYFSSHELKREPYFKAVQYLEAQGCLNIGFISGEDSWEYPFWPLLSSGDKQNVRIEHINVDNVSKVKKSQTTFDKFEPGAIIALLKTDEQQITCQGKTYAREWAVAPVSIYIKQ